MKAHVIHIKRNKLTLCGRPWRSDFAGSPPGARERWCKSCKRVAAR